MDLDLKNYTKIKKDQKAICTICEAIAYPQYCYILYVGQGPGDVIKDIIVMCQSCEDKEGTDEEAL